ncbi:MAG: carboxypeptidase-like regulatory domain-containing protein, partial [Acidobacteriia bacterium]|nr:carboxypeptidase-like regulatory domain-containing protein [Terriglobia bacterium]
MIPTLYAQTVGGTIDGTVLDASTVSTPIPGATITLINQDTNAKRTATTDPRGRFAISSVPPGSYRLEA